MQKHNIIIILIKKNIILIKVVIRANLFLHIHTNVCILYTEHTSKFCLK